MGDNKNIKPNTTPYKIIEVFSQGKHKALTGSDEHIMQECQQPHTLKRGGLFRNK